MPARGPPGRRACLGPPIRVTPGVSGAGEGRVSGHLPLEDAGHRAVLLGAGPDHPLGPLGQPAQLLYGRVVVDLAVQDRQWVWVEELQLIPQPAIRLAAYSARNRLYERAA